MSSTVVSPPANMGATAGPMLLGYVINYALFGALSVQVYLYYMSFPKDRVTIKCLVFGVYLLETLQTSIITHDMFVGFAVGFGNPVGLASPHLEWLAVPILNGTVSFIVQIFFAFRIFMLSKNKFISMVISAIALTQVSAGITTGVQASMVDSFSQIEGKALVAATIWLTSSAVCDVIIAGCMSYFLSQKDSGFKATRILLNRLVRLTIETGTLTAIVAIVGIVLFLAFPHNGYYTAPATLLGKLYSNTLLLIFNSRIRVVGGRDVMGASDLMELGTEFTAADHIRLNITSTMVPITGITVRKDTWTDEIHNDNVDQPKVTYLGREAHMGETVDISREQV